MSPISRARRAALGASVVALTVVVATACGPENSDPVAAPTPAVTAGSTDKPGAAPIKLPSVDELKKWGFDDWDKWAQQNVITPAVKGYWDLQKILKAKPYKPGPGTQPTAQPTQPPAQPPGGGNDPQPKPVEMKPEPHPFAKPQHVNGKLFFQKGSDEYVCSGTVVSDPANPGKSNLVWTASHCLHGGKGGKYHTNITFAPAFNSSGALTGGKQGSLAQAEPYGEWGAVAGMISPQWAGEADPENGGPWSQYDFGILKVANPDGSGKSLEEVVGGSVPIWFNAPREQITSVTTYGYPAGKPFDGMELEHCEAGKPARRTIDPARPTMLMTGCNGTGGDSGGGWFATKDGKQVLVSDTSIGGFDNTWEAGPYLDDVAQHALDYFSKKSK
ncbi:trypsin-like serine peptidase [Kitasatospora sp. NBC_00458]|uniref:trypsin-like serine peptidase n=1 Tax=Kitasatospora sp. NBC_00458 TaxID=2903568 RepID=UPI002E16DF6E